MRTPETASAKSRVRARKVSPAPLWSTRMLPAEPRLAITVETSPGKSPPTYALRMIGMTSTITIGSPSWAWWIAACSSPKSNVTEIDAT